jgi:hypothetical protein
MGHWLYPIQNFSVGYNAKVNSVDVDAFPDQYRAFDKVLGSILPFVDANTTLFIISDHSSLLLEAPKARSSTAQAAGLGFPGRISP